MSKLLGLLAGIALVAGLVLPTVLPEVANITVITLMVLSLGLLLTAEGRAMARNPVTAVTLAAGAVLLVALLPTARGVDSILAIMILAPVWLAGPFAALLARAPKPMLSPLVIGLLAVAGTAGAVGIAAYDIYVLSIPRGGYSVNNPIHLADLAAMLGFMALLGLFDRRPWRWVVLTGPALGLVAVLFSGSRGPLLAYAGMAAIASIYFVVAVWRPSRPVLIGLAVAGLAALLAATRIEITIGGRMLSLAVLAGALSGSDAAALIDPQRTAMYRSAIDAFMASPLFGYGIIGFNEAAAQFAPEGQRYVYEHLHNDIADFAVIGGVLGLLSYLMLLLAPVVGAARAVKETRPAVLYLGVMAGAGYLLMGLTNAMLGILTQTVLYGLMLALIVVLGREARR